MNSDQLYDLIEDISIESGKNAKIEMLKDAKCDLLEKVLKYTYHPLINYGIKQIDYPDTYNNQVFDLKKNFPFELLDNLASRTLTGNAARDAITDAMSMLTEKSAELLARIIRKDLRADFSESTCNKVYKNLLPEFPYMRCSLIKDAKDVFSKGPAMSQVKADGMFCNINVIGGIHIDMFSCNGKQMPVEQYENIRQGMVSCGFGNNYQFHGELLVMEDGKILPREIGNGILNSVNSGKGYFASNQKPVFIVWDVIPLEYIKSKGKYNTPYSERFKILLTFFGNAFGEFKNPINVIETKFVNNMEEAYEHYYDCVSRGLEGTILKKSDAIWKDGTSKEMFKLKVECDISLRILEIQDGKEFSKNEGRPAALLCESECSNLRVSVTIKNEDMQNRIEANPDEYIDKIVEVRANNIMKPTGKNQYHSLFLPRLVEADYRKDKTEADTLEKIQAQFDSLVKV